MYPEVEDQNTKVHLEQIFRYDLPSFLRHGFEDVMPGPVAAPLYPYGYKVANMR